MPNEIELKLRISEADGPKLNDHQVIRQHLVGEPITRRLISTYYDTPTLTLLDKKTSLRVRSMSGGWFQAVKSAGKSVAGLHQRMEWEDILSTNAPDFNKIDKISDPNIVEIFSDATLRDALKPIFTTDMMRTEWQLSYDDGTTLELALDIGDLIVGEEKKDRIEEIEIELKTGNPVHVFELALELQKDIPLTIENISKAQRGYAYYRPEPLKISTAKSIKITSNISSEQIFEQTAWECVRHLQSNQAIVLENQSIEGIKQMQWAVQRLEAAILQVQSLGAPSNEIRWLSHVLSEGDVSKVRTCLISQRYQRLLLSLGAWLLAKPNL